MSKTRSFWYRWWLIRFVYTHHYIVTCNQTMTLFWLTNIYTKIWSSIFSKLKLAPIPTSIDDININIKSPSHQFTTKKRNKTRRVSNGELTSLSATDCPLPLRTEGGKVGGGLGGAGGRHTSLKRRQQTDVFVDRRFIYSSLCSE